MVEHIGDAQQHAVEAVAVLHQPADAQADPPEDQRGDQEHADHGDRLGPLRQHTPRMQARLQPARQRIDEEAGNGRRQQVQPQHGRDHGGHQHVAGGIDGARRQRLGKLGHEKRPAAILMESARMLVLKKNDSSDCPSTARRIARERMLTSAVWLATAMVKEK